MTTTTTRRTRTTPQDTPAADIAQPSVTELEARIAELESDKAVLAKQVKDIDGTIQYLVGEYGTDWCEDGREDVNGRLRRVGLSPICRTYAYVALAYESDAIDYRHLQNSSDPKWVALREALAAVGLTPVSGAFGGSVVRYVDSDGDA